MRRHIPGLLSVALSLTGIAGGSASCDSDDTTLGGNAPYSTGAAVQSGGQQC